MSRNALVVGINTYRHHKLQNLTAPAEDAEAIAQRLETYSDFRVTRIPEIIPHEGEKKPKVAQKSVVSLADLEKALEQLFCPDSAQAPDTALFYFSGHGLSSDDSFYKGFLCTHESDPEQRIGGLSLGWIHSLLSRSPIKQQIVWLDCCHSGSLLVNVAAANPGDGESRDRCFIASSRDFEESWQDLNSPYSVLTKALLDGLDPTRLAEGEIDTFALADFVNKAMKGELQSPVCTNFGEAIHLTRSLQAQTAKKPEATTGSDICPYKGLEYFDCNDVDPQFFFGRDRLVSSLLDKVNTSNFLALVGASGNGKSSVLRAGLLHQLQLGQRISGSDQWRIRLTRPDDKPMENLALAFIEDGLSDLDRAEALGRASGLLKEGSAGLARLIQASSAPKTILVIDQFEEAFTRCSDVEEREQYFECLVGALSQTKEKLCLIIAMRADFTVKCMERQYSGLAKWIDQNQVSVLPMEAEELKDAICKPAQQADLEVDPLLVTEIQADIANAPGSLPLLQFALKTLWQRRTGNQLTLSSYKDLGGIEGALDQRATEIYSSFESELQGTIRHIFMQLTQLGEGAEDTRRRVFQTDLVSKPGHPEEQVRQVIDTLSNSENRLLVTSEVISKSDRSQRMAIVDVAHEALIRHWKLLRTWIEDNRDLLRKQRKIEASAIAWREQGQRKGDLLQGLSLDEAIQFSKKEINNFPLSEGAKLFISRSHKQRYLNYLKLSSLLLIPALIAVSLFDNDLRNKRIDSAYDRILEDQQTKAERRAVIYLVEGCKEKVDIPVINYLSKIIFGNCETLESRKLEKADLSSADLRSADLSAADLRSAELSFAELRSADLSFAELSSAELSAADLRSAELRFAELRSADLLFADLSSADLSFADLSSAELSSAELSDSILLATDLRDARGLSQLIENSVLICNSPLPENFNLDINRDCDKIAQRLAERFPNEFPDIQTAQQHVEEAKQKTWE